MPRIPITFHACAARLAAPIAMLALASVPAAIALGARTAASADALTLSEALTIAEQRSRMLVAQETAAYAAREMAVAAGQRPDPRLTTGLSNVPVDGADAWSLTRDFMTMRSVGLMQELTRGDKLDARAARYEREADAAEASRTVALADLQRGTAMAWFDRYYRAQMRDVLSQQRDEAELQIEAADLAYRSGLGPQSDVFAARLAVAEIEDALAAAERDVATATTELRRWIGAAASRPSAEPSGMDVVPIDITRLESELAHHPEIALMVKQEELARAEADIARTSKRADWSLELMYSERGSAFSDMLSLNASRPLQWRQRNRQDRELAARLAVVRQMEAEREEATRMHLAETQALLQSWQSNRGRLDRYARSLIPLAAERTRAATAAYRGGTGTLNAVLDSRLDEIATRLDHLRLGIETATLWAELNYLVPAGHEVTATQARIAAPRSSDAERSELWRVERDHDWRVQ